MSQWQPGYQYPMQTGYPQNNPQFQQPNQFQQQQQQPAGFGGPGLVPQPTGFPGQRPPMQGFQQPQATGFQQQPGSGFLQSQPTSFAGNFQARQAPPPPVPPLPTQYQQQNQASSGFLGLPNQQAQPPINRFQSSSPGIGASGLLAQPTGFPGAQPGRPLVPQVTGYVDPRLQMMTSTFLPMNVTSPASFGAAPPQLAPPQFNLQHSIQQHNQAQRGNAVQQMPWTLTKAEKKQYNDIFRSWDAQNTGFVSGQTALEMFGASGLPKDDLARIWTLADIDDRGKLNIAEFHVAMGLIYRRLSGMPVPDQLPPELVPPSARDLGSSVDFVRDILKHEQRNRSPSTVDNGQSRAKIRSFNDSSVIDSSRDATIYKHNDSEPAGGIYKPSSRHINRDDVRSRNDEDSPAADLDEMKRKLASTAQMLDRAADDRKARTEEDEELDRELDELKYRVKRVSEDLEYVSRGPRSAGRDGERRKLERELMELMHEKLPEVERKIKAREERKEREKREWARERDRANQRFGRYDDARGLESEYDRDRERPYSRGDYRDRDRDRDEDRSYRRDRDRSRDREYERERERERERDRPRSPPRARSPPPPPELSTAVRAPPPAPKAAPSPAPLKKMTAEERQAFVRAEAQKRLQERYAALGVSALGAASTAGAAPSSPVIDTSVEDRLQQEKKEAEEKVKQAEKQAEERERARRERLETERAAREEEKKPAPPAPAPAPPRTAPAPPAPKSRAPAPPPRRKAPTPRAPAIAPTPPAPAPAPAEPEVDPEEEAFRAREETIRKQKEARLEKMRQLEKQEEEARLEEERYQARLVALRNRATPSPAPPVEAPVKEEPPKTPTPPPAPAPPAPPAINTMKSTNPFSRLGAGAGGPVSAPPTNGNGSTNPWAAPPVARTTSSPAPPSQPKGYHTAPSSAIEEDWDDVREKSDDDSSDDEPVGRGQREDMARKIFGGIMPSAPTSRPASAAANPKSPGPAPASTSPPPAPPAPPVAPAPPPSMPPVAPPQSRAPAAIVPASAGPGDVSDLLRSIQGGMKLRSVKTVDKSGPPVSGRVLGDMAPPAHINAAPRPVSPPVHIQQSELEKRSVLSPPIAPSPDEYEDYDFVKVPETDGVDKRQSVGWFAERAADAGSGSGLSEVHKLPTMAEEEEPAPAPVPAIHIDEPAHDPLEDINKSIEHRVRSLYAYQGEGPGDLSFGENLMLTVHPSKTGGDWWYGTLISSGKSGLFPKTYVDIVQPSKAKALYSYTGNNPDELPFTEGDELTIVDKSEEEWWKTEQGGVVFIVPAAYLEAVEDHAVLAKVVSTLNTAHVDGPTGSTDSLPAVADPMLASGSLDRNASDSEDDSDSSADYLSFEDSDDDDDGDEYPEMKAEREARAHERQLVLQAAGLIVKQDETRKPPPRPPRSTKRRPAPAAPTRRVSPVAKKQLPPVPSPEPEAITEPASQELTSPIDHATRLDDAFDRYESFKNSQANRMSVASSSDITLGNRMSVASLSDMTTLGKRTSIASVDGLSASPTISSPLTKDGEGGRSYSHFLHSILGRSKTPEGEKKATLNISAPILISNPSSEGPERPTSPAFGSSWASLVDKTALEGIPAGERRRQEAIFELINTEAAYVRNLQLIVEIFYSSMVPILSRKEVTVIFANIEDILLTNTAFLSSLEERQKDCRLYIDRIGDILVNHIPNMGVNMAYCVNQATAIKVLKSLRDSQPELEAHLQRLRDDPAVRNLDLSSYLLVPMQRITRYPLLLKQILNHTETEAERDSVHSSIVMAEKILDHINESIRDQEGRETLKNISQYLWIGQGRLDLTAPTRFMGPRKLVKEGQLIKAKSGRKLYAFLCSDILVLTDQSMKSLYRMPIPLAQARVKEVGRDDIAFQVSQDYPRGGDSISLKAGSARDCQLWMQEIENTGRRCRHAEDRAMRKHRR